MGTIPSSIGNLRNLTILYASDPNNDSSRGERESSLSYTQRIRDAHRDLSFNQLVSSIPPSITSLAHLVQLYV